MKASSWLKWSIALAVAGAVVGVTWNHYRNGKLPEYQTVALDRGPIEATISATGNCNAVVTVQVGSQVSGNIKELRADFNTHVKKGDVVAVIEPDTFIARVQQVQANLDVAQAAVVNAHASLRRADADIANAQANLESQKANAIRAQLTMKDAKSKLDHANELYQRGMVSLEERDTSQTTYDTAVAGVSVAEAQVAAAKSSVRAVEAGKDVAETQLSSAEAQKRQIQSSLDQAKIDLERTKILAPVNGTVISREMDIGQTVAASFSAPTIFEIAEDLTKMQVDANVDEADIGLVRVGQRTSFTVDAYPDLAFTGEVTQIRQAPNIVQNVVTYDVVIAVSNRDLKLLPGMTTNVKILVDRRENALRLPNAALRVNLDESGSARATGFSASAQTPGATPKPGASAWAAETPTTGTTETGHGGSRAEGGRSGEHDGLARGGASGRPADGQIASPANPEIRTIWVLDPDGPPRSVRIRLGIFDSNYTEVAQVVNGTLEPGDQVVTGIQSLVGMALSGAKSPGGSGGGPGGRKGRRGFPF